MKNYKIGGMSLSIFFIIAIIVITASYLNVLPKGLIGALAIMMVLGLLLNEVGDNLPIVKDYLGGGAIVIIFGSAALATFNIMPKDTVNIITGFMKGGGFLNFYIAALITGSILSMDRKLLIGAAVRYLPAIIGCVVVSLLFVAGTGAFIGYGAKKAIFYIGIPIIGGGMGAGAVPLANIFGQGFKVDVTEMLSIMVPAVALGNAFAIVCGGLLNKLGKLKPNLSGNGELLIDNSKAVVEKEDPEEIDYSKMGIGLIISLSFYVIGVIIYKFLPEIHNYAWMILSVALVKVIGIIPRKYELTTGQWYGFVVKNLTAPLLIGVGVAYTDLNQVAQAFTWQYLVLVIVTVIGAALGAGLVGKFVGFYPIESAITAGLCMANMGGTGDVAVLSAAKRINLMPFGQISSRLGGAFILILASGLIKLLC